MPTLIRACCTILSVLCVSFGASKPAYASTAPPPAPGDNTTLRLEQEVLTEVGETLQGGVVLVFAPVSAGLDTASVSMIQDAEANRAHLVTVAGTTGALRDYSGATPACLALSAAVSASSLQSCAASGTCQSGGARSQTDDEMQVGDYYVHNWDVLCHYDNGFPKNYNSYSYGMDSRFTAGGDPHEVDMYGGSREWNCGYYQNGQAYGAYTSGLYWSGGTYQSGDTNWQCGPQSDIRSYYSFSQGTVELYSHY